jgi:hypothetical protein
VQADLRDPLAQLIPASLQIGISLRGLRVLLEEQIKFKKMTQPDDAMTTSLSDLWCVTDNFPAALQRHGL